ncbi:MAG: SH3 domain-containing protein [Candidatus Latescibacteria bacterium]|nr:SH3 domain-containing protein [Candidatus Latescibacterota bacterium]
MRTMRRSLLLVAALVIGVAAWAAVQQMSVQVRTGQLRATPSYLGKVAAAVAYGDRLTVVGKQGAWYSVKDARGRTGWIHESALTTKRVVLKSGDADVAAGAGGDEIALAGKGFNEQVENEFKARETGADYAWVDRMEAMVVTPEQAVAFLAAGEVAPQGGAR